MKNTENFAKDNLLKQVNETYGHIIVSWKSELQLANPDLVLRAIDLDDNNLNRIHKEFYEKYASEIIKKVNKTNYHYLPSYAYDSNTAFVKYYIYTEVERGNKIPDTFLFSHIDVLIDTIGEFPQALKHLSTAVQEKLLPEIKLILEKDPSIFRYLTDEVILRNPCIAEYTLSICPDMFYYIPCYMTNRFQNLLSYLTKSLIKDIAECGLVDDKGEQYFPIVSDKEVLADLLYKSPYAILLASDKLLLGMKANNLSRRLNDEDIRKLFVSRNPFISMLKKIKP